MMGRVSLVIKCAIFAVAILLYIIWHMGGL
jgi:hypothetical protein